MNGYVYTWLNQISIVSVVSFYACEGLDSWKWDISEAPQ
jgi:hypothetical protein